MNWYLLILMRSINMQLEEEEENHLKMAAWSRNM
jgi:hypothetical protein